MMPYSWVEATVLEVEHHPEHADRMLRVKFKLPPFGIEKWVEYRDFDELYDSLDREIPYEVGASGTVGLSWRILKEINPDWSLILTQWRDKDGE